MAVAQNRSTLVLWKDVIFALWIRQLRSKFNDKFGVSWLIIQPLSFILVMSLVRGRISGDEVNGIPMFVFMAMGFLPVLQFIQAWSSVSRSLTADKPLFGFRQVLPMASIITASLVELFINIIVLSVLCFIAILFLSINVAPKDPLRIMLFLFETQLLAYTLGVLTGLGSMFVREVNKVESFVQRPLLFISGAFFTLSDFPEEVWPYLAWNPILHSIELSRQAYNPSFHLVPVISELYLHLCTLSLLFLSLAVYFVSWKKAISR